MSRIIPRISLIGQTYIDYLLEPFLIHRLDSEIAFLRFTIDSKVVGLMFMEENEEALKILLNNKDIPDSFFYYWNDATNANGYSPKLLLMFSAIESLARVRDKSLYKAPIDYYIHILGESLAMKIFEPKKGIRNRLVHGEYFDSIDTEENYFEQVHKKIINFFNSSILNNKLLNENVVHPQRHPFGNKSGSNMFIKSKESNTECTLKHVLNSVLEKEHTRLDPDKYEHVFDKKLDTTY